MSDSTDDEELATDVGELADALSELREELRPRRGPFGLPAPPTPAELLRLTDERAIPFAIAVLETNVRALKLLQGAVRLLHSSREADGEARRTRDRAATLSRRSLERLDGVLSDLEASVRDGELPGQEDARELLLEARRLRKEVEDSLDELVDEVGDDLRLPEIDAEDEFRTFREELGKLDDDVRFPEVDVEDELRTIKKELGMLDDAADGAESNDETASTDGENGDGTGEDED